MIRTDRRALPWLYYFQLALIVVTVLQFVVAVVVIVVCVRECKLPRNLTFPHEMLFHG